MLIVLLYSCKSYQFAKHGYLVKGDNEFVNIDQHMMVYLGDAVLADAAWTGKQSPVSTHRLSRDQKKLLYTLGYDKAAYAVLFDAKINDGQLAYHYVALTNTHGVRKEGVDDLLDIGKLQLQKNKVGKWYLQTLTLGTDLVYHAVIPVSEKLWSEKYLSLVFVFKVGDAATQAYIQDIVEANVAMAREQGSSFFTYKSIDTCELDAEKVYFSYEIPQGVWKSKGYTVVKMLSDQVGAEKLAFYTILSPTTRLGAFKICKGAYRMVYSSLDGNEIWDQKVSVR